MKRLLAVAVVIAAFGMGASSASAAPPNFNAAQGLCEAQGALFASGPDAYACHRPVRFTEAEVRAAQAVCERAYGGSFHEVDTDALGRYFCHQIVS